MGRMPVWKVGTAGYSVTKDKWLSLPEMTCLEINSTFYRLPTEVAAKSWSQLPERVFLVLKVWQLITHRKFLKEVDSAWDDFVRATQAHGLDGRVGGYLLQLPPRFAKKPETVERLKRLAAMAKRSTPHVEMFVEFRHKSWLNADTYALVESLGWIVSGTVIRKEDGDEKWIGTMPPGTHLPPAGPATTYTRVHGSKGYRGAYGERALRELRDELLTRKAETNVVVFNNTFFESGDGACPAGKISKAAACDAVMFARLDQRGGELLERLVRRGTSIEKKRGGGPVSPRSAPGRAGTSTRGAAQAWPWPWLDPVAAAWRPTAIWSPSWLGPELQAGGTPKKKKTRRASPVRTPRERCAHAAETRRARTATAAAAGDTAGAVARHAGADQDTVADIIAAMRQVTLAPSRERPTTKRRDTSPVSDAASAKKKNQTRKSPKK